MLLKAVPTWGPTTPEGPGGPVFPWNPCGIETKAIKHVLVCVCEWGNKDSFKKRKTTSTDGL